MLSKALIVRWRFALLSAALIYIGPATSDVAHIKAALLLNGQSGHMLTNHVIRVVDDRVESIAPAPQIKSQP
tara:strand:- start:491 stop:706 length:216 start_codon:yes stop_codon:yes gene_type:complete